MNREKTMNRVKNLIAISAFSLLVLGLPAIASAQWGGQNDPYGRNGGYNDPYGRNGGYNNGQYGDMRSTVRNLKSRTRELTRQIDNDLDRSRVNGTRREDQINEVAKRFRDAVNDLDNNGRQNDREVRRVLDSASQLDRAIGRGRVSYNVQNLWSSIQNDLRYLGGNGYYDDDDDRNNRNNRNNRNPQNRNGRNLPNWWPF